MSSSPATSLKLKHWILIIGLTLFSMASTGYSFWLKANAQAFYVPSVSMEPTLPLGSRVLGWMHAYDSVPPARNDVALIELPNSLVAPQDGSGTVTFIKRVIGVPGDRVEMKRGVLTVNGVVQEEPFVQWKSGAYAEPPYDMKVQGGKVYLRDLGWFWMRGRAQLTMHQHHQLESSPSQPIPPDQFLILGDNRSNSNDSHVFGLVPRSYFKGRVGWQYWPRVRSF